ncbi:Cytochrome b561 domain-containing protein [Durusdinium trenchii]|uniref:Cytochrome b561 domain-containing protein n=2 Tax=Durusdinium trenchii TaxID=1381693 RepID=A0ABP0RN50_9DINO
MPVSCKDWDFLNVTFMVSSTALILQGALARAPESAPGAGWMRLHPLFMGLAFSLMISLGFWMYNYEDLPGEWIDTRQSRRKTHAFCQATGAVLAGIGFFVNYQAHSETKEALFELSSFSEGEVWLRLAHIFVGYACLLGLLIQVGLGIMKYRILVDDNDDNDGEWSVHELMGNAVFGLANLNLLTGLWMWKEYSIAVRAIVSLALVTSLVFGPRWDGTRGFLSNEPKVVQARHAGGLRCRRSCTGGGWGDWTRGADDVRMDVLQLTVKVKDHLICNI